MSINGVTYVGDDPKYIAQLELTIATMQLQIKRLLSQQAYLKGSTR